MGRPRRFEPATERRLILNAALRVMRRNGFAAASVADILTEADVSSRAFYRHFQTKDELLLALLRRDSDEVGRSLSAAVDAAATPIEALDAWLDGFLDLFFEPRRAARTAVMGSQAARRAVGYQLELARTHDLLAEPLARALARGATRSELVSPDPRRDARTILAVMEAICDPLQATDVSSDRRAARAHAQRFCWPALGLDSDNGAT